MIPSTAMVFQEHNTQVAVVTEDDRVHLKPITVSKLLGQRSRWQREFPQSDRIMNNPSAALLEGDKVRIVTPAPGYDILIQTSLRQRGLPGPMKLHESKKVPESQIAPVLKEASTSHEQATK